MEWQFVDWISFCLFLTGCPPPLYLSLVRDMGLGMSQWFAYYTSLKCDRMWVFFEFELNIFKAQNFRAFSYKNPQRQEAAGNLDRHRKQASS